MNSLFIKRVGMWVRMLHTNTSPQPYRMLNLYKKINHHGIVHQARAGKRSTDELTSISARLNHGVENSRHSSRMRHNTRAQNNIVSKSSSFTCAHFILRGRATISSYRPLFSTVPLAADSPPLAALAATCSTAASPWPGRLRQLPVVRPLQISLETSRGHPLGDHQTFAVHEYHNQKYTGVPHFEVPQSSE